MPKCTIVRGLPGSGKTHWVRENRPDAAYCSADSFFTDRDGNYNYDIKRQGEAHEACRQDFMEALQLGQDVVLDNTFSRRWEYSNYLMMVERENEWIKERNSLVDDTPEDTYELEYIEMDCPSILASQLFCQRNTHGVELVVIQNMYTRWEPDERFTKIPYRDHALLAKVGHMLFKDLPPETHVVTYLDGKGPRTAADVMKELEDGQPHAITLVQGVLDLARNMMLRKAKSAEDLHRKKQNNASELAAITTFTVNGFSVDGEEAPESEEDQTPLPPTYGGAERMWRGGKP